MAFIVEGHIKSRGCQTIVAVLSAAFDTKHSSPNLNTMFLTKSAMSTPYAHYTKTNHSVGTDEEKSGINLVISAISLMMSNMRAISATLTYLYKSLTRSHKAHLRLISPVGRIPPELLSDIFILNGTVEAARLPQHEASIPYFHHHSKVKISASGYLNVAQVSRRWRDIALGAPRLWNRVIIAPVDKNPWSFKAKPLLTTLPFPFELTKKAEGFPVFLTLDLRAASLGHDANMDYLPINPASSAVRAIDVVQPRLPSNLVELFQWLSQFDKLTHLVLDDVGIDVRSDSDDWPPAGAPSEFLDRLTHLHIRTEYVYQIESFFEIRTWSNLRSLTIDMYGDSDVSWLSMQAIFDHIPNLAELWIAEEVVEPNLSWSTIRINSDKLLLFALVVNPKWLAEDDYEMDQLFDCLTFPALTDLIVTSPLEGKVDFLWNFLIRSQCHLTSLTFTDIFDHDLANAESSLIHQAGIGLAEEFCIPSIMYDRPYMVLVRDGFRMECLSLKADSYTT
ncbi:hypothetical protein CONPUDRAFT_71236 [Coniophora puteana RWD-64-598 SS2]|uniref:F-box domain-containing protein n=1 Tax=Coniophora puteana (strain RWD-64-598) TaxID=741705 RepID=A0A5M3MZB0_CONPW|nr:uncharacterized protein CONPUDRAFT_71236 [Coniophora puteana RWD-64-598 SS2]EIW84469.1 hypothetical protein CONPUDRAFT_71236 [Coniophora puteana RWD-64-598 SS2]